VLHIRPSQLDLLWFQQGATPYTAQTSVQVLRAIFPDTLTYRFRNFTWPARSPDLPIPDHILCGYVKSKVYETRPANIDNSKQRIRECIQGVFKEMLQCVVIAFPSHCWSALNDMVVTYKM